MQAPRGALAGDERRDSDEDAKVARMVTELERDLDEKLGEQLGEGSQVPRRRIERIVRSLRGRLEEMARREMAHGRALYDRQKSRLVDRLRVSKRGVRRLVTGDADRSVRAEVRTRLSRKPVVRLIDRVSFTLGVINLLVTHTILTLQPNRFWLYYLAWITPLWVIRVVHYRRAGYGEFLFDNCYWNNLLTIVMLLLFPHKCARTHARTRELAPPPPLYRSTLLFQTMFILTNGPLVRGVALPRGGGRRLTRRRRRCGLCWRGATASCSTAWRR